MKRGFLLLLLATFWNDKALAGRISALLGPPSLGQGGSNPVSIPPINPLDWQFTYLTDDDQEWVASVIPGLFFGQRWRKDQLSFGFSGGVLISVNGYGVGLAQSLHWESQPFWKYLRFEAEVRQVIGYTQIGAEFPYAIRAGFSYEM